MSTLPITLPNRRRKGRRTGDVARLPYELRTELNKMIRDGVPYADIIQKLGAPVAHLNEDQLSRWKLGGYEEWLKDQARIDAMGRKRELAMQIVRENEGGTFQQAGLHLAASQIYEALEAFDPDELTALLRLDPQVYPRLVHALFKLSDGNLKYDRYRAEVEEKKAELQNSLAAAQSRGLTDEVIAELQEKLNLL